MVSLVRFSVCLILFGSAVVSGAERPNVLFLAVDDLRPELACYGKSHIHSPHIDALAARGVLFERAYCMVPTCGASRASLMTGIRPARDRFVNYLAWAEKDAPNVVTLNTHFKQNGYTTISLGKIFHHKTDSSEGWSEVPWRPTKGDWHDQPAKQRDIREHKQKYPQRTTVRGKPYESFDAADEEYRDGEVASRAIEYLEKLAQIPQEPFFLAVGFYKPHLPFCAPKKYWDLYDFDSIKLPENNYPPKNAPVGAVHDSGELRAYATIPPKGPVSEETARRLIHGYYACVSFTDAQIGRVIDALDRHGLSDNTIVVLWGDHGWQLGEHGMWNKHSCFETSMHAPLLVAAPRAEAKPGTRVRALVEFIDIYPTLCELTGLPSPEHLHGESMVRLMKNPKTPWKDYAIGRYKAGDTIRSETHRFSEFRTARGQITGSMLYDHQNDPAETQNVVAEPANRSVSMKLAEELMRRMGR